MPDSLRSAFRRVLSGPPAHHVGDLLETTDGAHPLRGGRRDLGRPVHRRADGFQRAAAGALAEPRREVLRAARARRHVGRRDRGDRSPRRRLGTRALRLVGARPGPASARGRDRLPIGDRHRLSRDRPAGRRLPRGGRLPASRLERPRQVRRLRRPADRITAVREGPARDARSAGSPSCRGAVRRHRAPATRFGRAERSAAVSPGRRPLPGRGRRSGGPRPVRPGSRSRRPCSLR